MVASEFGEYLKRLRKDKSLSTHELADLSGVSQSYITQVESGRKQKSPSPDILSKLSKPLGVSHAELMVAAGHVKYDDWFSNKVSDDQYDELFTHIMLGFPSREAYLSEALKLQDELLVVLRREQATYNGYQLTKQDRQRVMEMLKVLFPDYK